MNQSASHGTSRRTLLRSVFAVAAATPILSACTDDDPAPTATSQGDGKFPGVTINVACNPSSVQACTEAGKQWGQVTGAKVNAKVIPFAERATSYASWIVSKDASYDVLYGGVDFISNFGDKLYLPLKDMLGDTGDYVPAALGQLTKGGALLAAPLFADMLLFFYNKTDWSAAALPEKIPGTWDELYGYAPKLTVGNREPCVIPWNNNGVPFWIAFFNSTKGQLFSDDKSQLLFDNDKGLAAWQAISRGFQSKFFGLAGANAVGDQDTSLLFNQNLAASQAATTGFGSTAGSTDPDKKSVITKAEVGVSVMPGITAGTSGSVIVAEGLGINKFTRNRDAALSFVKYTTGPEFQKQMVLGKAGQVLPSSRLSVSKDPEVAAGFPLAATLAEQASAQLAWPGNAPFKWNAPFLLGLTNLSKGTWTPDQAHEETIKAVKKLMIAQLGS
ncbi:extracellular solute-binding protein [Dactylosporangium sp. NBC_01737]|uniref:ABC transporter substrate-binding protein n=1 Tax=Dactylosporangium sp. NBC_01737 TaxID=2975959 RepID=UPI002E11579A|nr:extracellular solute-binding protein [Dactylosporangium sp. NBC_01737]